MVLRSLPLLLAAGCFPGQRDLIDVPLTLEAPGSPLQAGDVLVQLDQAYITLEDLELRDEADDIWGVWAQRRVAPLGPRTDLGALQVYEGTLLRAAFRVQGEPALVLRGTATQQNGATIPFVFTPVLDLTLDVAALWVVDAETPPDALRWTAHPEVWLAAIDWSTPRIGGRPLTTDMGQVADQLTVGLAAEGAWTIVGDPDSAAIVTDTGQDPSGTGRTR